MRIEVEGWQIKVYSISVKQLIVSDIFIETAKEKVREWLRNSDNNSLEKYNIATLILHEGKEGCFAIINWWIDENMLQQFVYLTTYDQPPEFKLYSDSGIITCVWELAVIWFERNAWVEHILSNPQQPNWQGYLSATLNTDI